MAFLKELNLLRTDERLLKKKEQQYQLKLDKYKEALSNELEAKKIEIKRENYFQLLELRREHNRRVVEALKERLILKREKLQKLLKFLIDES